MLTSLFTSYGSFVNCPVMSIDNTDRSSQPGGIKLGDFAHFVCFSKDDDVVSVYPRASNPNSAPLLGYRLINLDQRMSPHPHQRN